MKTVWFHNVPESIFFKLMSWPYDLLIVILETLLDHFVHEFLHLQNGEKNF